MTCRSHAAPSRRGPRGRRRLLGDEDLASGSRTRVSGRLRHRIATPDMSTWWAEWEGSSERRGKERTRSWARLWYVKSPARLGTSEGGQGRVPPDRRTICHLAIGTRMEEGSRQLRGADRRSDAREEAAAKADNCADHARHEPGPASAWTRRARNRGEKGKTGRGSMTQSFEPEDHRRTLVSPGAGVRLNGAFPCFVPAIMRALFFRITRRRRSEQSQKAAVWKRLPASSSSADAVFEID